ncbi:MAG: SMP-30/gluconolactonase/LRE family protein [Gemmataceae bacterium]
MSPVLAAPFLRPTSLADAYLPEGPREVLMGGRSALAWVNIQTGPDSKTGSVNLWFWQADERRTLPQPGRPGFLLPTDRSNILLVGMDRKLGLLNLATNDFETIVEIETAHPRTTINDAEIIPGGGGIVFGTKDLKCNDPIASLYMWTVKDNLVTELKSDQTVSNGKVFRRNKTGLYLFDIDSPRKKIIRYAFDLPGRKLDKGTTAVSMSDRDDFPDGMIDCGEDSVIVAFFNPNRGGDGEAARYDLETGKLIAKWRLPGSPRVTCPLVTRTKDATKVLFTTAVEGMSEEIRAQSPNAGCLFLADFDTDRIRIGPGKKMGVVRMNTEIVKLGS